MVTVTGFRVLALLQLEACNDKYNTNNSASEEGDIEGLKRATSDSNTTGTACGCGRGREDDKGKRGYSRSEC